MMIGLVISHQDIHNYLFSKEIAEMMSYEVNNMAKHHDHPLLSEIEPLTD